MAYTYYIFHIPTKKHYYGARWAKDSNPDDFWKSYFTSSKEVWKLLKEYGKESFRVKIRKVFNTGLEARLWEHKVLKKLKVSSKSDWLNKTNGQPPICNYSRKEQGLGRRLSEAHIKAISRGNLGKSKKPQTEEHKELCRLSRIGSKRSEETKKKMREAIKKNRNIYRFEKDNKQEIMNLSLWCEKHKYRKPKAISDFSRLGSFDGWVRHKSA